MEQRHEGTEKGEDLRTALSRAPLPLSRTLGIAIGIAEGLSEAHSRGVIHHDLKPENIFLDSDGTVRILDLSSVPAVAEKTHPGTVLATAGYMSPEQVREQSVDARSDVFSFGCVLHEMLTGARVFQRDTPADTLAAVLNEEPKEIPSGSAPAELTKIVRRCLEKNPDDRFPSTRDVSDALREVLNMPGVSAPSDFSKSLRKRVLIALGAILIVLTFIGYHSLTPGPDPGNRVPIAVIDFVNNTPDRELDCLSGLLITQLEQSKRLDVLTRSRMFDILGQLHQANVQRIDEQMGRALCKTANVRLLAVGSVQKFGELYSIDVKIIDVETEKNLFAAKTDGSGKEAIPSLIDRIAEQTRSELQEPIEKLGARRKVADVTTSDLQAYAYYFQGEQLLNQLQFNQAGTEFQKAVAIDPTFALAYYRLATCYEWTDDERSRGAIGKAIQNIDRSPQKERLYIQAESAVAENDFDHAIYLYKEILNSYPMALLSQR